MCAEDVEILGKLDDQATLSSNFAVTPFVGAIPCSYSFVINRREVKELIEAPVTLLMDPTRFSTHVVDSAGTLQAWGCYRLGDYNITGVTARILKQFVDLVFST